MAYEYPAIATDSNFHALALAVSRNGAAMSSAGAVVTISIKDRDTLEVIVPEGSAATPSKVAGRWEYWFPADVVARIVRNAVWLIEWKISYGAYTWRLPEPAFVKVRKKL